MVGDIYSPRIIIVDGASFRGSVDMGDIANMPSRNPSAERQRPAPVARPAVSAPPPSIRPAVTAKAGGKPASAPQPTPAPKAAEKAAEKAPDKAPDRPAEPLRPAVVTPLEPPAAKGLPQKAQKTRVIVKRK